MRHSAPAMPPSAVALAFLVFIAFFIARRHLPWTRARRKQKLRTLIVLGSGGHTAEMLASVATLDARAYAPRIYVRAKTDALSLARAIKFERTFASGDDERDGAQGARYEEISRAREVGQTWSSSAATTARAFVEASALLVRVRPDVVLCNGPGTCVPIVFACALARACGMSRMKVIYVESACRARELSLTGRIVYHSRVADTMCVMWESLARRYPRCTFIGRVM